MRGRKKSIGCLSLTPNQGPGLQTRQVPCMGMELGELSVYGTMSHPLSHTSQGSIYNFGNKNNVTFLETKAKH